jgi:hypothetical protein
MAPTDNRKWVMLMDLTNAHFPEDEEVVGAIRRVEELATKAVVQAEEE